MTTAASSEASKASRNGWPARVHKLLSAWDRMNAIANGARGSPQRAEEEATRAARHILMVLMNREPTLEEIGEAIAP